MKFLSIIFLVTALNRASAQEIPPMSIDTDSAKIIRDFLVGYWEEDSTLAKIEFVAPRSMGLGLIIPGSFSYDFFRLRSYPIHGSTISWPPYDCLVKKINEHSIEIQYSFLGENSRPLKYKRATSVIQ